MDFDVDVHLGAVERSVSSLERDGNPARDVVLARTYAAAIGELWNAVTSAERIGRWFAPVTGRLERGGRYQIEGNAGGLIETCEPPSRFAATWEFGGSISWLEVRLAEAARGTRCTLIHTSPLSPHWDQYGPGATGVGWDMGLLGLWRHLDKPTEPKLDEAEFAASPAGKAFIGGCSTAWGRAAIANGENAEQAQASAERTRAFYTGEPA